MRRADRIAGAALLALSVAFGAAALRYYTYWSPNGPGPAFLPFWLSVVMGVLAAMLLIGALRERDPGGPWLPAGEGRVRIAAVLGATIVFVALLKVTGMILGTALFLVVLLRFLDRNPWSLALGVAAATSGLIYLVFTYWLRVPFPVSALGI